jgi:hypothetical protein
MEHTPTIFHITNYKAGSQWVAEILKYSAPERFVKPREEVRHFLEKPVIPGMIYPTVYVTRPQFEGTLLRGRTPRFYYTTNTLKNFFAGIVNRYHFRVRRLPFRSFVIIRDLRDILVSDYFSLLVSHPVISRRIANYREQLSRMNQEDGFLFLCEEKLPLQAQIQQSWFSAGLSGEILLLRFEDLLKNEHGAFEQIIEHCQVDVDPRKLYDIVKYNSFDAATGRKRGQENIKEHLRKGIAGDWRNYFTDRVKAEFKLKYGDVLIETGYEKDLNW